MFGAAFLDSIKVHHEADALTLHLTNSDSPLALHHRNEVSDSWNKSRTTEPCSIHKV